MKNRKVVYILGNDRKTCFLGIFKFTMVCSCSNCDVIVIFFREADLYFDFNAL